LVLTGASGNAMDSVRSRLAHSKVKDRLLLTGFVDDADLAPLYQGAVAFAYPSLQEGFGLPVLEALQCGAVVVTANNSALPEVGGDAVIYC
jgi:glycosyltransferase involved in cell wall biosynthesis